jgi:hypothetical protein
MPLQLLPFALLLLAPPPIPDPPADPPPEQSPEFIAALEHLKQTDSDANHDPVTAATALVEALGSLADYAPEVAASPDAKEQRQFARLNLARAYLLADEDELAERAMDEAVREAMGEVLDADLFGPSLADLYKRRVEALEQLGRARLLVRCAKPCEVYVNETAVDPSEPSSLLLGSYRVWIEDPSGRVPRKRELVELSEAEQVYEVAFAAVVPPPPPRPKPPAKPKRIMPRGAEIALLVIGAGLTATGAALVAHNSNLDVGPMIGGAVGLAVGAGMLTSAVITLSIDERKLARGVAHQATLSWTMSF